jgi:hypothetical protein
MIPDFPKEKEKLMELWNKYLQKKISENLGFLGTLPQYRNYEGDQWKLSRDDGSVEVKDYDHIQGLLDINIEEVPDLSPEKIRLKLDNLANEIATQISKNTYAELSRVTTLYGNEIDAKNKPFSKDLFLEMIEKVALDFDQNGDLIQPAMVVDPVFWEKNKEEIMSWERDEGFVQQHDQLIAKKKEEWIDRENNRKLVD